MAYLYESEIEEMAIEELQALGYTMYLEMT